VHFGIQELAVWWTADIDRAAGGEPLWWSRMAVSAGAGISWSGSSKMPRPAAEARRRYL